MYLTLKLCKLYNNVNNYSVGDNIKLNMFSLS